jgi:hypothetical protein
LYDHGNQKLCREPSQHEGRTRHGLVILCATATGRQNGGGSQKDTHAVSPLDELLALKSLKEMAVGTDDKRLWQGYIDNSTRMLRLAASAMKDNPAIEEKLGVSGLQGVLALASLLKKRHADKVFDKVMEIAIGEGDDNSRARAQALKLDSVAARYAKVNKTKFVSEYTDGS